MQRPVNLTIGGIPTIRASRSELARLMVYHHSLVSAGESGIPMIVTSSNGKVIADFHGDPNFRSLMEQADIIDADGMPVVLASRLLCKHPLAERVATTDFIHDAAQAAAAAGIRFFLLGGLPGVADAAALKLQRQHEGLLIAGARNGYFSLEDEQGICDEVLRSGTDVLWVGLGSPRQEAFAVRNREKLRGLTWIRTCGGLFDHVIGRFRRAPGWVQAAGFEWLFRLAQEPARLGPRYLVTNPIAAYHLLTKTHD
jgi:N-acetylglucosaminyldiphosphoundecaprenol N-acetyl-beta-D-mannosaminyltransferase